MDQIQWHSRKYRYLKPEFQKKFPEKQVQKNYQWQIKKPVRFLPQLPEQRINKQSGLATLKAKLDEAKKAEAKARLEAEKKVNEEIAKKVAEKKAAEAAAKAEAEAANAPAEEAPAAEATEAPAEA